MIKKLQSLKGKAKLLFSENISKCYDNTINGMDEDLFAGNA